eukprot:TRINITY_DN57935_c0_g1_i1.p1 TRINITY_DN57935_c0_g1~~TRINITY_DN57935_c0_g1_i1.p1  ORF type:complete len:102 (+),score=17.98 TRINITY_DN57935_c0_g1_i1:150-455(+)
MKARDFEAMSKINVDFRNFLESVRLADNEGEDSISSEEGGQRQHHAVSPGKRKPGQEDLCREPEDSGKPRSASSWTKMQTQMWAALRMIRSSNPSRVTSFG